MFSFLPAFSRGTGFSIDQLATFLSFRELSGLAAPYIGRLSDRAGTAKIMIVGGALIGLGLLLMPLGATGIVIGLGVWGFGQIAYHVAMNAWVANEVSYSQRGRATGQIEMSWAAAALIGLPLAGLLIDNLGWRAAPLTFGLLSLPLTFMLARRIDTTTATDSKSTEAVSSLSLAGWATLISFGLMSLTFQLLVFTHGIWLEQTYSFDPTQVGFAIAIVGLAELVGSYGSFRFTDDLGKKSSIIVGISVLALGLAGLVALNSPPLYFGLGLLALSFLGFEYAIVSAIPLIAELHPQARAQTIGRAVGLSVLARAGGNLIAGNLVEDHGFDFVLTIAIVLAAATIAIIVGFVREPDSLLPAS